MASTWVRGKTDQPKKRRVVLIYETMDAQNTHLEQLLERIPYGQGNKILLECLRTGAKAMLAQMEGKMENLLEVPSHQENKPAATTVPPTQLHNNSSAGFSKAATRMFEKID
jgi:hypothetical protein